MRDKANNVSDLHILLELSYANPGVGGAWVYIKRYLEALFRMIQDSDDFRVTLFIRANKESVGMVEDLLSDDSSTSHHALNSTIDVISTGQKINISMERLRQEHVVTSGYIKKWDINVVHWFGNHACLSWGGSDPTVTHFITVHDLLPF